MDMPVPERERGTELQPTVEHRQPHQDDGAGIDRSKEEERPEAVRKQGGASIIFQTRNGHHVGLLVPCFGYSEPHSSHAKPSLFVQAQRRLKVRWPLSTAPS